MCDCFSKYRFSLIGILLILCFSQFADAGQKNSKEKLPSIMASKNANWGTEFMITFHPMWMEDGSENVHIYVMSDQATRVDLYIPRFDATKPYKSQTVAANKICDFTLTLAEAECYIRGSAQRPDPSKIFKGAGITVISEKPAVCMALSSGNYTGDSYLPLPVNTLGKEYIVAAYTESVDETSQYMNPYTSICAVSNNTQVSFTLGGNHSVFVENEDAAVKVRPGEKIIKTLYRGDVWLIAGLGPFNDITGSLVTADKPVAVISGNYSCSVPGNTHSADYLIEQDIPTDTWGKKYYVSPISTRLKAPIVRIFAKEPNTTIYRNGVECGFLSDSNGMNGHRWIEKRFIPDSNNTSVISSDKPINVVQYNPGYGDDSKKGDPFQMNVVPESSFLKDITFMTPDTSKKYIFDSNYINIVYRATVDKKIPDSLMLGTVNASGTIDWVKVSSIDNSLGKIFIDPLDTVLNRPYYSKTIVLKNSTMYYLSSKEPISAYLYGIGEDVSYGQPCGFYFPNKGSYDTPKDSIHPYVEYKMQCNGDVLLSDGKAIEMPADTTIKSHFKSVEMLADKSYNYIFKSNTIAIGVTDSINWSLKPRYYTQDAHAEIVFTDMSGNDTTVIVDYRAVELTAMPQHANLVNIAKWEKVKSDITIKNMSSTAKVLVKALPFRLKSGDSADVSLEYTWDIKKPFDPGEERIVTVNIRALKEGDISYEFGVDDSCNVRWLADITAKVLSPVIEVEDYDFGSVKIGADSVTKTVSIKNTGTVNLVITGFNGPSSSTFTSNLAELTAKPLTITTGKNQLVTVTYKPISVIDSRDSIVIISNADNTDPVCILSGKGIKGDGVLDMLPGLETVSIKPNPATDNTQLLIESSDAKALKATLISSNGSVAAELGTFNIQSGSNTFSLDFGNIPSGKYFLLMESGGKTMIMPVVIAR